MKEGFIMSFVDAIKNVFSNYANFKDRARRSEYWYFCLFQIVVSGVLSALGQQIGIFSVLGGLFSLAILVPSLAVTARRFHDIGKSGWWMLISLVPLVGAILCIIWMAKDSDPGENQYGPNPKETAAEF